MKIKLTDEFINDSYLAYVDSSVLTQLLITI